MRGGRLVDMDRTSYDQDSIPKLLDPDNVHIHETRALSSTYPGIMTH